MLLFLLSLIWGTANAQLPDQYESWDAEKKASFLWDEKIAPAVYEKRPSLSPFSCSIMMAQAKAPLSMLSLGKTFNTYSDEMPKGRTKFIHPLGSVVKIRWVPRADHPFSGVFQGPSATTGLARLSVAGPPSVIGFTPGIALKLFIDGKPSLNIVAMNSLEGQGKDHNFFRKEFSNVIPPVPLSLFRPKTWGLKFFETWFSLIKTDPKELPMTEWASLSNTGEAVKDPVVPWKLVFFPANKVSELFLKNPNRDFRENLEDISVGTTLYKVYAKISKDKDELYEIGSIETASPVVSSKYADTQLFFRHPMK